MFTTPLVRFPYSTDGIPRITSMLSMSSVLMVRISTPRLVISIPSNPSFCIYCMLASVFIGAPSTTNRVPSELVEYCELFVFCPLEPSEPVSRRDMELPWVSDGVCEMPPGRSSIRSPMLVGCKWLIASRPMVDTEPIFFDSEAVTTTSPSW